MVLSSKIALSWVASEIVSSISHMLDAFAMFVNINTIYREGNGTHSSPLAWKIPWMEEPGRLQSMGSLRVGHD